MEPYRISKPKKNWTIRRAKATDAPALTQCMHAAYRPYTDRIDPSDLPPLNEDYADEIRNSEVWIVESVGNLVGALILVAGSDSLQIANVAVHPSFQGNGLGRGLLDFAQKEAIRREYSEMHLATHSGLSANITLYEHLGWTVIERGEAHVRMSKPVP